MTAIDATGLMAIEEVAEKVRATGRTLLLCGARSQPARVMERAEFHEAVGEENILPHVQAAVARARETYRERYDGRFDRDGFQFSRSTAIE